MWRGRNTPPIMLYPIYTLADSRYETFLFLFFYLSYLLWVFLCFISLCCIFCVSYLSLNTPPTIMLYPLYTMPGSRWDDPNTFRFLFHRFYSKKYCCLLLYDIYVIMLMMLILLLMLMMLMMLMMVVTVA